MITGDANIMQLGHLASTVGKLILLNRRLEEGQKAQLKSSFSNRGFVLKAVQKLIFWMKKRKKRRGFVFSFFVFGANEGLKGDF